MGLPVATTGGGICFAFPDICKTQVGPATVPIPYPNIGQLSAAEDVSTTVKVCGNPVILKKSKISKTMGDEAGSIGGVSPKSGVTGGEVKFTSASQSVKVNGEFVVRMTDTTTQNKENAIGIVLGGEPTVMSG